MDYDLNSKADTEMIVQSFQKKIVILDDEECVRQSVEMVLKREYIIFPAENGKDVMDILEREDIDLLISDIKLKNENGLDVIESVLNKYNEIPFVVISSSLDKRTVKRAEQMGAKGILDKPFSVMELQSIVHDAFG